LNVCVFAGSFRGSHDVYRAAAVALGNAIATRGWTMVYGGAEVGLMGVVADAALAAGGRVVGVVPQTLVGWEKPHPRLTDLVVTADIASRKAEMSARADAFVCLPGGIGTMEEMFQVWTASQLGIATKPVALVNTGGYYDLLIAFLSHIMSINFLQERYLSSLVRATDVDDVLDGLARWVPTEAKWDTAEARRLAFNKE
jgi:uncharacterized protein (TIGR00730 family)